MLHFMVSDLGLHCLLHSKNVCNTKHIVSYLALSLKRVYNLMFSFNEDDNAYSITDFHKSMKGMVQLSIFGRGKLKTRSPINMKR